ncbi:autotransporter outer membrane beta-barrel domain-containing protein [Ancylobacter oerskovii]|uniref:Autotransporter domain-containing protein n=1 Tax=Ancylobacter oerskovii TaxID=459519 RepID=A0ABW4YRW3_9HYPH|nr:autotransporter outer membrane beta-barrel domain-containing protein [Ancylobacter oerskovii]MBS7545346.1 autotransporter domain-containing protein [Ancylobacter oerskovii]
MTNRFFSSASGRALLAASSLLFAPLAARADSFTVPAGTTQTKQQTVSGTDSGRVEAGGVLDVTKSAVIWDGPATGAGIVIVNDGTITSEKRAFDTDGEVSGRYALTNNGTISSTDDGFRLDDAFAGGDLTVVNNGSITSQEGQAFDLDSANDATAKVRIENAGTITANANDAVRLGGGTIELINSGTIQTLSDEDRAIKFDDEANVETLQSFRLVNEAGGRIIGGDDAIKIAAETDTTTARIDIENHGLIDGGAGQALDFADLTSPDNVILVTNYGTLQSSEADGIRPGAGASVINYGLIQSTDLTSDGDGIDFQEAGGSVVNKTGGSIYGAKHGITGDGALPLSDEPDAGNCLRSGCVIAEPAAVSVINEAGGLIIGRNGSGINVDSSGDTLVRVINYGIIRGEVTGLLDDDGEADGVADGDGDGVDVDGKVELHNYGLIQGTGATGTNDGVPNTADGLAIGGGLIHNHATGVIEAFDNYPNEGADDVGRAILVDDSNQGPAPFATTLINEGIIRSDGVAVTFIGDNADTIDNAGTIQSDNAKAVDMGGGDDLFIYRAGSTVTGYVTGGDGSDTFRLAGSGSFALELLGNDAQYRDFEALFLGSDASYALTGSSSFAGNVTLDGQLNLNGSLASANVAMGNGARLSGNASLGELTVNSGATVSPGNSIGTINVAGTVSFNAGSTYVVEANATTSDQIVAGTSAINGGTVVMSIADGPINVGQVYTIVSAQQTTTPDGQFTSLVAPDYLFIDPTLGKAGASITVTLARNGTSFASFAQSANQAAVANALDAAGKGTLYSSIVSLQPGEEGALPAGYDLTSGEAHASLGTTLYGQNTLVADTLVSRLRQASASAAAGTQAAALGFGGPATAYAAKAPAATSPIPVKAPPAPAPGAAYAGWVQGYGQWSTADGNGNAAEVNSSLGGFLAGGDVTIGNTTFGLAAGYVSASSDVDDRLSSVDADTALIAAYAGTSFDAWRLRAGASYGWSDIDSRRTASLLGITENPRASYDGSTANLFLEAAYAVEMNSVALEPFAQIAWSWVNTDSFTETGAPATGLSSSGLSFDTPYSTLGFRLATSLATAGGTLTPHASLAWRHAYGDITPEAAMAFIETGSGFSVAGAPIAQDSFVVGAGLGFDVGANLSLNIGYEGQFGDAVETNALKGGLTYRF